MRIRLLRKDFRNFGIFGRLLFDSFEFDTLEHSFLQSNGYYRPAVPVGVYKCKRGPHRLHSAKDSFETFALMDVPKHTNILFHTGNYNSDSEGCILLGLGREDFMLTNSRKAFMKFMELLEGVEEFELSVEENPIV